MNELFDPNQKTLNRSSLDDLRVLSGPFWGELRIFLAVAKAKSFNRAAETLNMSQPTVSRQVKRLQDVIGSQLVIRMSNGIELTTRGKELAASLLALDEKLFEISTELKYETRDAEGLVRISITEALAGLFVVPGLGAFNDQFPRIRLHVRNPINLMNFRDNQTDIMVGFGPVNQSDVTCTRLGQMHFIPVAARNYINRYGLPKLRNLDSHFFVDCEYYSAQTAAWAGWRNIVSQGVVAHICDNSYAYGQMVKCGYGIGLLCNYVLSDSEAVPLDLDVHTAVPIYIIALTERLQSRPVRLVFDWLATVFGPEVPWFGSDLRLDCPAPSPLTDVIGQSLSVPFNSHSRMK